MEYTLGVIGDPVGLIVIRKEHPTWQKGLINFIGGKVEPGECPFDCIARETFEETGLDIPTSKWINIGMMIRPVETFEWKEKIEGNSKVYTHPHLTNAIVENNLGIFYLGKEFPTVDAAKRGAISPGAEPFTCHVFKHFSDEILEPVTKTDETVFRVPYMALESFTRTNPTVSNFWPLYDFARSKDSDEGCSFVMKYPHASKS